MLPIKQRILGLKKKRRWILLAGTCSLCIIFYIITMLSHDLLFLKYKKAFNEIQHPTGTKFIKAYNSFGNLDVIRDVYNFPPRCDYRVGEVREYSGTKETISAFYAAETVTIRGSEKTIGVIFIPIDSAGLIDPFAGTHDEMIDWGPAGFDILESLKDDQLFGSLKFKPLTTYYYIGIGGILPSNLDIRCQSLSIVAP